MIHKDYILHLVSWYPSKEDEFDGDFIQRHIRCIPARQVVVHAQQYTSNEHDRTQYQNEKTSIDEYVQYYKKTLKIFNPIWQVYHLIQLCQEVIKKEGKPKVIHVHVALYAGFVGLWLSRKLNVPLVMTEHSTLYTGKETSIKSSIKRRVGRLVLNSADIILPVSKQLDRELIYRGFNSNKSKVVHNVVSSLFFETPTKRITDHVSFIHVSSLNEEQKNISGMIEAFEEFQGHNIPFHWTLVGNYNIMTTKNRLENSILNESNYSLVGPLSQESLAELLSHQDVFVLFSNYESFSVVVAEAMAAGLPVITSRCGGITEEIDDDIGIQIEKGNISSLTKALVDMSQHHSEYDKNYIRGYAESRYSTKAVGEELRLIYQGLQ